MRCYFQVVRPVLHILQYQMIHLYRLFSESLVEIKITKIKILRRQSTA
jgi:hypothetical protein